MAIVYKTLFEKMPQNCAECHMNGCYLPLRQNSHGAYTDMFKNEAFKKRHKDCPLVEVSDLLFNTDFGSGLDATVCTTGSPCKDLAEKTTLPRGLPYTIFGYFNKLYYAAECDGQIYLYDKKTKQRIKNSSEEVLKVAKLALECTDERLMD